MGIGASVKKNSIKPRHIFVENKAGKPQMISFGNAISPNNLETLISMLTGCDRSFPLVLRSLQGALFALDPVSAIPENDEGHPYKVHMLSDHRDQTRIFNNISQMQKEIQEIKEAVLSHRSVSDNITFLQDLSEFKQISISNGLKESLRSYIFNMWEYEYNEMLCFIEFMYSDMNIISELEIHPITLRKWLLSVQANYRNNPFHNFRHAFSVTQMMYALIGQCEMDKKLSRSEIAALLIASVIHDIDHPGLTNNYQVKAKTELALRYNDISPLENHHASVAFRILAHQELNIFYNISEDDFRTMRNLIIELILATDMSKHNQILAAYQKILSEFNFQNDDHRHMLLKMMIKTCDVSNEVRPTAVAERWCDCLLEEYFKQGDLELAEGLPIDPFMDRTKMTKSKSQIGFIKFVLIPMYESLGTLLPPVIDVLVPRLHSALEYYESMDLNPRDTRPISKVEMEYEHLRNKALSRISSRKSSMPENNKSHS